MDIFDIMPASRIGVERDDDTSSDEEERLTTAQIMALRVKIAAEAAALEPEPEPDPADVESATRERIGELPGVPVYVGKETFDMVNQRPVTEAEILATVTVFKERLPRALAEAPPGGHELEHELVRAATDERAQHIPGSPVLTAWLFHRGMVVALERLARLLEPRRNARPRPAAIRTLLREVRGTLQKVQTMAQGALEDAVEGAPAGALDVLLDEAADTVDEVVGRASPLVENDLAAVEWLLSQLNAALFKQGSAAPSVRPSTAASATAAAWLPTQRRFAPQAVAWEQLEACCQSEVVDLTTTKSPGGQLFDAIEANDLTQLRFLLDAGLSASVRGQGGDTALMAASVRNYGDCLTLLLDHGADAGAGDDAGDTAFHYACSFASLDCIRRLARYSDAEHVGKRNRAGLTGRSLAESLSLWTVVALIDEVFSEKTGLSPPLPAGTSLLLATPAVGAAAQHNFRELPPASWTQPQVCK